MRIGFSYLMDYYDGKEDRVNDSITAGLSTCEKASAVLSARVLAIAA